MKLHQLSRTAFRLASKQKRFAHNTASVVASSVPSFGSTIGDRDGIPTSVLAAAFAATGMLIAAANSSLDPSPRRTFCEDSPAAREKPVTGGDSSDALDPAANTDNKEEILFWPNGVTEDDLNDLVEEMLKDPALNLSLIPDALERRIYKSTIQLTFNAFYAGLAYLNGLPFLSHEIRCTRIPITHDQRERTKSFLAGQPKNVNVEILAQVADRMIANPVINSSMLPDAIERQVYINCMIVIFRVLSIIFSSFRVTVCGHDFGLSLEPHQFEEAAMNVAVAHSSLSRIDMDRLKEFAEACGVPESRSESMTEGWSFWDRMWNRQEFMVQLHSSLYGLVLGILDDVLANTKIRVLSDTIALDIVPSTHTEFKSSQGEGDNGEDSNSYGSGKEDTKGDVPVGFFATATFLAGLGLGMTISTAINNQR
jgi:hypothetical protein